MDRSVNRTERDSIGELDIPISALFGINSQRAASNFSLSGRLLSSAPPFVTAFAHIKKAAALANADLDALQPEQAVAIAAAANELALGQLNANLIVDLFEGSGGTSLNMNVNEVLANRGLQHMGKSAGEYAFLHPNDHVNRSQSTNDVVPSAIKYACWIMLESAIAELENLTTAFARKASEFSGLARLGRTCLQDAQPMTLGQSFGAHVAFARRSTIELSRMRAELAKLPMGATAIGTGLGAAPGFQKSFFHYFSHQSNAAFEPVADLFDGLANADIFVRLSSQLKTTATGLGKIANDFIILSSGPVGGLGELALPAVQAGSSIMPGKVNPVIPMAVCQVAFAITGYDAAITAACQQGQLEINPYEPVIAVHLFDSINLLTNAARLFRTHCIDGILANADRMERNLLESSAVATALLDKIGYDRTSALVKRSIVEKRPFIDIACEENLLTREGALQILRTISSHSH